MISIEECKKILLDNGESFTDDEVKLIREHLDDITIIPVPKNLSKVKMVRVKDAILVDDYPENLREWKEAGGLGVRFDLDMDGKGFPVINKLDELIKMF